MDSIESPYRLLVERLPAVIFLDNADATQETVYINPRLGELLGYSPDEWNHKLWIDSIHPDDRIRVLNEDRYTNATHEPFLAEYRLRRRDGRYIWVREETSAITDASNKPRYWLGIFLDITEQKKADDAIRRRDAILEAVGFAAEQFLKSQNWEDCIGKVLARVGKATEASRVYIFKKHLSPTNQILASQIFEWCDLGIESQVDNPRMQNEAMIEAGFGRLVDLFDRGFSDFGLVRALPPEEQVEYIAQGILSYVCVPLQVGDSWWGYIGIDDCLRERIWSATEVEALRTAANVLGAAIQRQLVETGLISSEERFSKAFHASPIATCITTFSDGHFVDANDAYLRLSEWDRDELMRRPAMDLGIYPSVEDRNQFLERLTHGQILKGQDYKFRTATGETRDTLTFYELIQLGGETCILSMYHDISDKKHAEEEVKRRADEFAGLYETSRALSMHHDLDEILYAILHRASALLNAPNCAITLYNETLDDLVIAATIGPDLPVGTHRPLRDGMVGCVAQTLQPLIVNDYQSWEGRSPLYDGLPYCAVMGVPMLYQGKLIGVLDVAEIHPATRKFNEADLNLLSLFAGQAAAAIFNARLFEAERYRRLQADTLREATAALTVSLDLSVTLELILDLMAKFAPYDSASIFLMRDGQLEITAARGLPEEHHFIGKRIPLTPKWKELVSTSRHLILANAQEEPGFEKWAGTETIRGWMAIPLIAHNTTIGFLDYDSRSIGIYSEDQAGHIQTFANEAAVAIENARLVEDLRLSNLELMFSYDSTLEGWGRALEMRDKETHGHTLRVTKLTLALAKYMNIPEESLIHIRRGVLLHDIGKIAIPDRILKKTGPLTESDWNKMRMHPKFAFDLIQPISYLRPAIDIPYCHHECWDGKGYPRGLKGEEIPLAARIFSVVDVWDALRYDRSYRKAWPREQTIQHLRNEAGKRFDPNVVEAFLEMINGAEFEF